MQKLLIAESSDAFASALEAALRDQWSLQICNDGYSALDALRHSLPDALLINLRLPQKDGLSVLEEAFPVLPPVVLALTDLPSTYVLQTAASLGVGYMMQIPCQVSQIKTRLADMAAAAQAPPTILERHLKALQLNPGLLGYRCAVAAILTYKEDSQQLLQKEIYPRVAKICGTNDNRCVEYAIRYALQKAWEIRNIGIWSHYFPQNEAGDIDFPGNLDFIKCLAERI